MRAHLVQLDSVWENHEANFERAQRVIAKAGVERGDLIVLPEMFDTGFSFNLEKTVDREGKTLAFLRALARDIGVTLQGARTVLGPDGRGRNRASVIGPDGAVLAEYDKVHPFSYGRESEFFSGGDAVMTYAWQGAQGKGGKGGGGEAQVMTVCPAICYDLRFPELFRIGMLRGAEIFAIGANWPSPRKLHREALSVARAIENQAYVLAVNRAGRDPHLEYAGGSMAIGPKGDVLGRLDEQEGVLSVEIDPQAVRTWRKEFPATRDIRLMRDAR